MKYLNLTEGFNPCNSTPRNTIEFESLVFSGGEPHIKIITEPKGLQDVTVTIRINSFNDLGLLCVADEALDQIGWLKMKFLFIPYFPGARQDRRMVYGEPLTVKVYADIINQMDYEEVMVLDPHSDVTPALIGNSEVMNNHTFVETCLEMEDCFDEPCEINIVSPDAGSEKKVAALCMFLSKQHPDHDFNVIKCGKVRDVKTGKLSNFTVPANIGLDGQAPCFIIDDICDGGGTFIGLAEELKKKAAGNLYLMVTHGIFSKGTEKLGTIFKSIYTTNSIGNTTPAQKDLDNVKIIDIEL